MAATKASVAVIVTDAGLLATPVMDAVRGELAAAGVPAVGRSCCSPRTWRASAWLPLGLAHAIGHALGGRYDIAHGITLAMVLPPVLEFSAPVRGERMAALAFALGAGDHGKDSGWNAAACVDAVAALRSEIGLAMTPASFGVGEAEYRGIAEAALGDEVLANTPRQPAAADICRMLGAADDRVRIR